MYRNTLKQYLYLLERTIVSCTEEIFVGNTLIVGIIEAQNVVMRANIHRGVIYPHLQALIGSNDPNRVRKFVRAL